MAAPLRTRTLVLIGILGLIQAAVTGVLFLLTFANGMHRFDTGETATPIEQAIDAAAQLFGFPLVTVALLLPARSFPGLLGWIPFILNGLLWGCVAVLTLKYRRRRTATAAL